MDRRMMLKAALPVVALGGHAALALPDDRVAKAVAAVLAYPHQAQPPAAALPFAPRPLNYYIRPTEPLVPELDWLLEIFQNPHAFDGAQAGFREVADALWQRVRPVGVSYRAVADDKALALCPDLPLSVRADRLSTARYTFDVAQLNTGGLARILAAAIDLREEMLERARTAVALAAKQFEVERFIVAFTPPNWWVQRDAYIVDVFGELRCRGRVFVGAAKPSQPEVFDTKAIGPAMADLRHHMIGHRFHRG